MNFDRIMKIVLTPIILAILVKSINVFSFYVADLIYGGISNWDADNSFLVLAIHHIIQAVIILIIIAVYGKVRNISFEKFGFKKTGFDQAIKYVLVFISLWTLVQTISGFILIWFFNEPIVFGFPLTTRNYLGHLAFQIFLSGTSEEMLFRVMVIVISTDILKNVFNRKALIFYMVSIFTIIFMFDHINFNFSTLSITHFNFLQQLTLLIFGIFYGWLFIKYENYWAVAIAHNALNGIISLSALLLYLLLK